MVAPFAIDAQIARRHTLSTEAKSANQSDRRQILRLDICFQTVQPELERKQTCSTEGCFPMLSAIRLQGFYRSTWSM